MCDKTKEKRQQDDGITSTDLLRYGYELLIRALFFLVLIQFQRNLYTETDVDDDEEKEEEKAARWKGKNVLTAPAFMNRPIV